MLRNGATQGDVAKKFGVSQSAVSQAIARGNIKFETGYQRRIPWKVRPEHSNLAIPRMLRLAERVRAGDTEGMPEYLRQSAEGFMRTLHEMDAVIHYEPEASPWWFRVPRRHGIDNGLVREPDVEDSGDED